MRTLIESILDADLDIHDEAVFTEQIIPKILKNITKFLFNPYLSNHKIFTIS